MAAGENSPSFAHDFPGMLRFVLPLGASVLGAFVLAPLAPQEIADCGSAGLGHVRENPTFLAIIIRFGVGREGSPRREGSL